MGHRHAGTTTLGAALGIGLGAGLGALLLSSCAGSGSPTARTSAPVASSASPPTSGPSSSSTPATTPATSPAPTARPNPEPRRSYLSIPALDLRQIPVVRYRGTPDDAPGTRIQNDGPTASPRGPGGGVGPGVVGNFIVTGHRTSHTAPFRNLPDLRVGDRVRVRSGEVVYVYRITQTRSTSFRSSRSLARQSAAVPGFPGVAPTRAMITLSTCATPEDRAAGNYWSDQFGNPEHRIDKIGVLIDTRPALG